MYIIIGVFREFSCLPAGTLVPTAESLGTGGTFFKFTGPDRGSGRGTSCFNEKVQ